MPLNLPAVGTRLTRVNFADVVKSFVDTLETNLNTLTNRVSTVESSNATKYTKPAGGIPSTDLDANVQAALGGNTLGTPTNPVTDPAAARPTGLTIVYWRTTTDPTNWAVGDINMLQGT